jgi:hypothetical protein
MARHYFYSEENVGNYTGTSRNYKRLELMVADARRAVGLLKESFARHHKNGVNPGVLAEVNRWDEWMEEIQNRCQFLKVCKSATFPTHRQSNKEAK